MKKSNFYSGVGVLIVLFVITSNQLRAQEEKSKSDFSVNVDLYSNYIWRGSKYGSGPAVQPSVKFNSAFFTVGVWGSFDASGYAEADPYVSFALPMGFSVGLTDYYYPGLQYFDVTKASGSQAFELNGGFTKGGLSLAANYIINEAGGAGSAGGDTYFQAGYAFNIFNLFVGAGNGWHTADGSFAVCNLGIGASKEIKLFDAFTIPVNGQVIFNPDKEQLYVVVGFSF
jgi:uncharacterized protein (TIGR02001 family)